MKTGYARCSTNESKQDIERQVRELKQAGAERVFLEYEHGDAVVKEQLSLLLEQAQPGDTVITLEVSRLARSTKQLCEIIEAISQKRLCLVIVGSITMDCRNGHADPMTEAFLQMAGVFSQLELAMIRARALWNGKRQSQGREDRQTGTDRRRYTACFSSPLSRVPK